MSLKGVWLKFPRSNLAFTRDRLDVFGLSQEIE